MTALLLHHMKTFLTKILGTRSGAGHASVVVI